MKIRSEQLDALLRQDQLQKQAQAIPKESFGSFFEQEIGRTLIDGNEILPQPGARAGGIDPMLLASLDEDAAPEESSMDALMAKALLTQADGMLSTLDTYAQTLNNPQATPRSAWELLGSLDSQVSSMRSNMNRMSPGASQELESVVNELEVLAATEKFKFNRGDF